MGAPRRGGGFGRPGYFVRGAWIKRRRMSGANQLPRVIEGVKFTDGVEGDFRYARISITDKVEYAGFTGVSRYKVQGLAPQAFPDRRDHEYSK